MRKIIFPTIFLATLIPLSLPAQIYVDITNGNNASAGTSAGTALKSIQAGIVKANLTANTILYVAAGTYTTNNWGISNIAKAGVCITNTLRIYGGYTPGTFASQVAMSELDAQGTLAHVVFISNAANVVLDHFTLRGGFGSGSGLDVQGGGLHLYKSWGTLVTNVVASNNYAPSGGGVALNLAHSNRISLTASSNRASFGGGVYFANAFGNTYSGMVTNNVGGSEGGGFYIDTSDSNTLSGVTIGNTSLYGGGGVYLWLCNSNTLSGSLQGNLAIGPGGGLYVGYGISNQIGGNIAANGASNGGGVFLGFASSNRVSATFNSNSASNCGGAVFALAGSSNAVTGPIRFNSARVGGGVYISNSFSTWVSGAMTSNTAQNFGGAIAGDLSFSNTFSGDMAGNQSIWGGGVYLNQSYGDLVSSTCTNNTASNGGGVCLFLSGGMQITGFVGGNRATNGGGGYVTGCSNSTWSAPVVGNTTANLGGGFFINTSDSNNFSGSVLSNNSVANGGGMYLWGNQNLLSGTWAANQAGGVGGGLYLINGNQNSVPGNFSNNTGLNGGAIDIFSGMGNQLSGLYASNTAGNGGAVFLDRFASNNFISGKMTGNRANASGGGIYVYAGSLSNRTTGGLYSNYAAGSGGGYFERSGSGNSLGSICSNNTASVAGAIYLEDATNFGMTNCALGANSASGADASLVLSNGGGLTGLLISNNLFAGTNGFGSYAILELGLNTTGHKIVSNGFDITKLGFLYSNTVAAAITNDEIQTLNVSGSLRHDAALATDNYFYPAIATIYVDATNGNDAALGITPATARQSLQAGLNALVNFSSVTNVMVSCGLYTNALGGQALVTVTNHNLRLSGGWLPGFFTNQSGNSELDGKGIYNHVVYVTNVSNFKMDGFTIRGGMASGAGIHGLGGGVGASAIRFSLFSNLVISNNWGSNGGGVGLELSYTNWFHGLVISNTAYFSGGGIFAQGGEKFDLIGSLLTNQCLVNDGGGLSLQGVNNSSATLTVEGNRAGGLGGGMRWGSASGQVVGRFVDNVGVCGGIFLDGSTNFQLIGSVVSNNTSLSSSADTGVFLTNMGSGLVISNCVIAGTNFSAGFAILETGNNTTGHVLYGNFFVTNDMGYLYRNFNGGIISNHEMGVMNTSGSPRHDASIALSNAANTNGVIIPSNYVIPQAVILSPPAAGTNYLVYMSSASVAGTSPITNYLWSFGDGTSSNGELFSNVAHSYSNMLTNFVVLTVVDSQGFAATTSNGILILGFLPVNGRVAGQTTNGVALTISSSNTNQLSSTGLGGLGLYQFWVTNDTYTLTPSKLGYRFTPPNRTFTVSGGPTSNMDFTAAEVYPTLGFVSLTNFQQIVQVLPIQVLSDAPEMLSNGISYVISNTPGIPTFITNVMAAYGVSNGVNTLPFPDGNYTLTARAVDQPFGRVNSVSLTVTFYNQLSKMNGKGLASKQAVIYNTVVNTSRGDMVELFFYLQASQAVRVAIYDKRGRPLMVFPDRVYPAGPNRLTWETLPKSLEAGVYFAQFDCGEFSKAVPVVMVQK